MSGLQVSFGKIAKRGLNVPGANGVSLQDPETGGLSGMKSHKGDPQQSGRFKFLQLGLQVASFATIILLYKGMDDIKTEIRGFAITATIKKATADRSEFSRSAVAVSSGQSSGDREIVAGISDSASFQAKGDVSVCSQYKGTQPYMTESELRLFQNTVSEVREAAHARGRSRVVYMEWGTGGSTRTMPFIFDKVYSVENARDWCEMMMLEDIIKCLTSSGRLEYMCRSYGKTTDWGLPISGDQDKYRGYVEAIKETNESYFDLLFVDGRYRVACALGGLRYIDENSRVLVHDFWNRLSTLGVLLEYYDPVHTPVDPQSRSLVVLRKKPGIPFPTDLYESYVIRP